MIGQIRKEKKSLRDKLLEMKSGERVLVKRNEFTDVFVRRVVSQLRKDGFVFVATVKGAVLDDGIFVERVK